MLTPPWLNKGDKIAITAPAGKVDRDVIERASQELKTWGLIPVIGATIGTHYFKYSATDQDRLAELQALIENPEIKAIWCARGGYGVIRLLTSLKWQKLKTRPKWIIGLSDITHLHAVASHVVGICSVHGFMPVGMNRKNAEKSISSLKDILFGKLSSYTFPSGKESVPGKATGKLVGGNLSILYSMAGTPFDFNPLGKILFLEEVSEHHYHIDRMLQSLKMAGNFEGIRGLIIGSFTDLQDRPEEFGKSVKTIIKDLLEGYNIPVWFDFPAGHDHPNMALPLGAKALMEVEGKSSTLKFEYP